ncbi:MAG: dihydroorotase [Kiritimatiellia bacterium]
MIEKKPIYIPLARLIDPATGRDEMGAFYVTADGVIAAVPEKLPAEGKLTIVDRPGLIVVPGLCDVHVHFRDPGATDAEDLISGSAAAANGGFTRVVTMPNTLPATDTPALVHRAATALTTVSIYPSACGTVSRAGKLCAPLEALAEAGAAVFTDDGAMISNPETMKIVMMRAKKLGKPVMDHAVRPDLARGGMIRDCPVARTLALPIFPPEAEVEAVRDDIARCRETGCALHLQHLSCAGSVELIRAARAEGLPVTAEVTPHHLAWAAEDIPGDDGNWRMNPPLGTRADVAALRAGLLDGTLTLFATDHAPHSRASKARGFKAAPFGIIGLETAVAVTWEVMVRQCGMTPLAWAEHWITAPNQLLGLPVPTLAHGAVAEWTLIDPELEWVVDPAKMASKSADSPWVGQRLRGKALATYRKGRFRAPGLQV